MLTAQSFNGVQGMRRLLPDQHPSFPKKNVTMKICNPDLNRKPIQTEGHRQGEQGDLLHQRPLDGRLPQGQEARGVHPRPRHALRSQGTMHN